MKVMMIVVGGDDSYGNGFDTKDSLSVSTQLYDYHEYDNHLKKPSDLFLLA